MNLDINIGDILLGGRFKNKRIKVKSIGTDELGQPIFNKKRKLLSVRIEKKLPKEMQSSKTKENNMNKQAYLEEMYRSAFEDELEKIATPFFGKKKNTIPTYKPAPVDPLRQKIESDLSRAGLYENVYSPSMNKAESALSAGYKGKRYGANEWDYAMSQVNKSKALKAIGKKHGVKIKINDTGPAENAWKFEFQKQALLEEVYSSAFEDELDKIASQACPGSKIRSKGMGRGLGYGKGEGPIGNPVKNKEDILEELLKKMKTK